MTSTQYISCIERTYDFVHSSPTLMNPGNENLPQETIDARLYRPDFDRYIYA